MDWKDPDSTWAYLVRLSIKVALVFCALYVAYHFYERNRLAKMSLREEPQQIKLPDDAYVFVPKSYVTDIESARRKLVGEPLWIKEGFRWSYQPGDRLFEPLEVVVPSAFVVRGGEAKLLFERDGREASFGVGPPGRLFVDDIFFVKDPREIYDHWTGEKWDKAEQGVAEVGMSEIQIGFALGVGEVVRQSPGLATRIVDYKRCREGGLTPVRVTYKRHTAAVIEPM